MSPEAVLRTLIALCMALEIRPEDLARFFRDGDAIQAYYERLRESAQEPG